MAALCRTEAPHERTSAQLSLVKQHVGLEDVYPLHFPDHARRVQLLRKKDVMFVAHSWAGDSFDTYYRLQEDGCLFKYQYQGPSLEFLKDYRKHGHRQNEVAQLDLIAVGLKAPGFQPSRHLSTVRRLAGLLDVEPLFPPDAPTRADLLREGITMAVAKISFAPFPADIFRYYKCDPLGRCYVSSYNGAAVGFWEAVSGASVVQASARSRSLSFAATCTTQTSDHFFCDRCWTPIDGPCTDGPEHYARFQSLLGVIGKIDGHAYGVPAFRNHTSRSPDLLSVPRELRDNIYGHLSDFVPRVQQFHDTMSTLSLSGSQARLGSAHPQLRAELLDFMQRQISSGFMMVSWRDLDEIKCVTSLRCLCVSFDLFENTSDAISHALERLRELVTHPRRTELADIILLFREGPKQRQFSTSHGWRMSLENHLGEQGLTISVRGIVRKTLLAHAGSGCTRSTKKRLRPAGFTFYCEEILPARSAQRINHCIRTGDTQAETELLSNFRSPSLSTFSLKVLGIEMCRADISTDEAEVLEAVLPKQPTMPANMVSSPELSEEQAKMLGEEMHSLTRAWPGDDQDETQ